MNKKLNFLIAETPSLLYTPLAQNQRTRVLAPCRRSSVVEHSLGNGVLDLSQVFEIHLFFSFVLSDWADFGPKSRSLTRFATLSGVSLM